MGAKEPSGLFLFIGPTKQSLLVPIGVAAVVVIVLSAGRLLRLIRYAVFEVLFMGPTKQRSGPEPFPEACSGKVLP